jgi:hypothetical protein
MQNRHLFIQQQLWKNARRSWWTSTTTCRQKQPSRCQPFLSTSREYLQHSSLQPLQSGQFTKSVFAVAALNHWLSVKVVLDLLEFFRS